jgi:hypothetical protein
MSAQHYPLMLLVQLHVLFRRSDIPPPQRAVSACSTVKEERATCDVQPSIEYCCDSSTVKMCWVMLDVVTDNACFGSGHELPAGRTCD